MASFSLEGFALITGGAGGIGKEIGFTFAESGVAGVVFADINEEGAKQVAEESKKLATRPEYKAIGLQIDVTDAQSVQNVIDKAVEEFGRLDYAINAAGVDVEAYVPFSETPESDYDRVLDINAKGTFLVTKAVSKVMQAQEPRSLSTKRHGSRSIGRGAIVNISSALAFAAVPAKAPYIASKHALLGITRASAMDLNRAGIRVNMVCPSWVNTPMFEEESRRIPPVRDLIKGVVAAGRPAEPDEVAAAVQYLCSPIASYITGHSLVVDSGLAVGPTFGQ